jgi:hypothetical protein
MPGSGSARRMRHSHTDAGPGVRLPGYERDVGRLGRGGSSSASSWSGACRGGRALAPRRAGAGAVLPDRPRDRYVVHRSRILAEVRAVAGEWEIGAIAYTCARNRQRLVILRGISDLVTSTGGEVYGNMDGFVEGAGIVMTRLMGELPAWLERMR